MSDGHGATSQAPVYRWNITVRQRNAYGDRIESETPTTILAATKGEVTGKVRVAFDAVFDDFRGFWSHDWTLVSMDEVAP